jgi:hypothetical protein
MYGNHPKYVTVRDMWMPCEYGPTLEAVCRGACILKSRRANSAPPAACARACQASTSPGASFSMDRGLTFHTYRRKHHRTDVNSATSASLFMWEHGYCRLKFSAGTGRALPLIDVD